MVNLTPFQTRCSWRKIRTLLFLGLFLSSGFSLYLQAKDYAGDARSGLVLPDYTITTTGNAIVITDVSGNGETLTVSESGSNIRFNVTGRTYQIDAGAVTPFTTPADVALSGKTSITINTAAGNDIINIGAFTANLPSLTLNGGTGDDAVNFNGDINFATDAILDADLQNDDATPGIDALTIATNANVKLFGTGTATVKVSKNVVVNAGGSLETENGDLLVEANQQAAPTAGNFQGVVVTGAGSLLRSTGSGSVTVKGKGGDAAGAQHGVLVSLGGQINGHTVTVTGNGGASSGNFNYGVLVGNTNSLITSSGGNVSVTGTGGGAGTSRSNSGVYVAETGQITAGGMGTVTVTGNGGASSGSDNYGVYVIGPNSLITSSRGNVSVTGTGGGTGASAANVGVYVAGASQITAAGSGTVTVVGNGGASSGGFNYGVYVEGTNSRITSSGGNVSVTGKEGSGTSSFGIITFTTGSISTATNGGNLTLIANSINIFSGTSVSTNAASTLTMRPFTNNTAINLGSATNPSGGPLSLSDAEMDLITTGTLIIGDATAGTITVSANISRPAATNVQLISNGDVNLSGGGFNTNGGTLLLDPGVSPAAVKPTFNGTDVTATTLSFGSDLALAINGTTPGTQYDQLIVVGSIDLTGVSLVLSGMPTLMGGETFTIIDNDGSDAITGTFTGFAQGATLSNFLGSGLNATISYTGGTGNDVVITVNAPLPDYTITTTGNAIVITDVSGNGETLTVSESGSNIRFNVTGRTYKIDAGAVTPFTTPADVALSGKTSVTINAAAGNDIINIGAFTGNLPSLTLNGGTGDDAVNFNGDVNFATDANLDADLQNDDATPGVDALTIATNANVKLFGTGTATVKVSKNVTVNAGGSLETTDGNLLVEANQQATPTAGSFQGVVVTGAGSLLQSTGSGSVTVKGKGGDAAAGSQYGIFISNGGQINGTAVTVIGNGGASSGNTNYGVYIQFTNSRITSSGGNVSVTGMGGGAGTSGFNIGVYVTTSGQIMAGGTGTVTVTGNGGATSGNSHFGVVFDTNALITSSGGNVSVTGTGGGSGASNNNFGVYVYSAGQISAGGTGTVIIIGNGGASSGNNNYGVLVQSTNSRITSSGGNVSVTGKEGNGPSGFGIITSSSGSVSTATNGGNLSLIANSIIIEPGTSVSTNAASTLSLRPFTAGTQIDLGSASDPIGGPLSLSDAELDRMTTGTLIIGDATAGAITVSANLSRPTATNVQLISNGDVNLSGGGFNTNGGTLLLDPGTSPAAVKPTFNGTDVTASTLSFGSDLALAINGTTPGTQYDQLNVVGSIDLTGVSLALSGMPSLTGGETFTIIDNDGSDAIAGTFTGLAQGATITNFLGSGRNATISYTGGSGNDVVITVSSLPTAIVSGGGAVCFGAPLPNVSIALTGTPPWSITYSNGTTSTTVPVVNVSPYVITGAGPGTYTVTAVSNAAGMGTSISGSAQVTVNALPVVSAPQTALCTSLTMTLSPTSGGTWQSSNPSMASVNNAGLVTGIAPGMVSFTFTQTGTGCSAATANVTIKPTPTSKLTASKVDVCPNERVTLTPNCSIPTASVNWNPGGPTVTPAAATLPYVYRASCVADGCVGNETSVEVRTHRILVDMKDLDVGALPLPIVRAVKDNMEPTNLINAPVFPRRWTFIANGCNASESAAFKLSGPVNFSTIDNAATYAMFANDAGGFYSIDHPNYGNGGSFPDGTYTLTIDLRSQDGVGGPFPKNRVAVGSLLATRTLQFTVVGPSHGSPQSIVGSRQGNDLFTVEGLGFAEVSPNPVSNTMRLKVTEAKGQNVSVSLVDASGRTMLQRSFVPDTNQHQEEFNVGDIASGMYFLRVNTENKNATLKVVKVQ